MIDIGTYEVKVQIRDEGLRSATLASVSLADLPKDWWFDWSGLWWMSDPDCQRFIKLGYGNQIWGLMRYGIYPYPQEPYFLEIEQIEAHPSSRGTEANRYIRPIGKWLIWYAAQTVLAIETDEPFIFLSALDSDLEYYRDTVQMEYIGPLTIAPGEDGHAFRFSKSAAIEFCRRQQEQWGIPIRL